MHEHTAALRTAESGALKLSLYFIGRAYKSKASASQILEALHTPIRAGDVQNADTYLSVHVYLIGWRVLISTNMHHECQAIYRCLSRPNKSCLFVLRIIISWSALICEANYKFSTGERATAFPLLFRLR